MSKVYYIDGGVYATTGNLYTRDISAGDERCPDGAIVITPPNGELEITKNTGSIFDTYYVREWVTASGISGLSKGAICAFADIYVFTIRDYVDGLRLIESMLDNIPKDPRKNLYLQQQFAIAYPNT